MDIIAELENRWGIVLNEAQRRAVLSGERYVLLLAVPGSGKTTVLVARLAHRIANGGADPARMLNLTFNRETAREMKRRYSLLFGHLPACGEPAFHTLHSFCYGVLRRYAQVYRREMPRLIGAPGAEGNLAARALRELYRSHTGDYLADELLETIQTRIGYAKNRLLSGEAVADACPEVECFAALFDEYEAWKRENHLMDFDDMLTFALDILQKCPRLLAEFRSRYDEICLDEAQDTSLVQFRILRMLASPEAGKMRFFLVGDEDQSIYAFRGASPGELLRFPEEYPGACLLKMEQNYRSGQGIVAAASRLIRHNRQRYDKGMICAGGANAAIDELRLPDFAAQYAAVEELLRELPAGKTAAVLYRNNVSALPLIDRLRWEGIPFYIREPQFSWFTGTVLRDLTAFIRLADDPGDAEAFSRIYYKLGYSRGVAERVREQIRESGGVFECILTLPSVRGRLRERTLYYRDHFPDLLRRTALQALEFICSELGYEAYLDRVGGNTALWQEMNAALSLAEGAPGVFEYLDKLEELRIALLEQGLSDPAASVTLSTFHSAKGMEFDWVILLDLQDGVLPAGGVLADAEILEGERRLFYVGVTRARERLVLPEANRFHGRSTPLSPFVRQLMKMETKQERNMRA